MLAHRARPTRLETRHASAVALEPLATCVGISDCRLSGHSQSPGVRQHQRHRHLLESGSDRRTVQELLGHSDVTTTMVCTHVLNRGGLGVKSPFDRL